MSYCCGESEYHTGMQQGTWRNIFILLNFDKDSRASRLKAYIEFVALA